MGSKRAVALGLVVGSLFVGCSTDRKFSDGSGGGAGDTTDDESSGAGKGGASNGSNAGSSGANKGGTDASSAGTTSDIAMGGSNQPQPGPGSPSCADDEFEDGSGCTKLTVCADDEFEKTPAGPKQDRVCEKASQCAASEYEASPPSSSSDRICSPLTVCAAGTFVSAPPGASADRACKACDSGNFTSELNSGACKAWSACASGETESVAPSATSDRVCSKCGAGKYESAGTCLALTVCSSSQYESTAATATSDRVCSAVKTCQPGSKQTAAPTTTTDRQCAPCSSGTFSTQTNAGTCKSWTVCGSNQKQSVAGTATSDVVCVDKPICSTAADRACSVDCPCASGEGVCTASNQCASGASCVAGSGKKVGRSGDTCLANHCNNDTKDSTETSIDCGGECGCRATFDVVTIMGIPTGALSVDLTAMSRDGKKLAGYVNKDRTSYATLIALDGKLTALEAYGKSGWVVSGSADGNVWLGGMGCANPPSCTDTAGSMVTWTGTAAPKIVSSTAGNARALSSSGTVIAGDYYDAGFSQNRGFYINGSARNMVADLSSVVGMTPDGRYLCGALQSGNQAGLWAVQTQLLTKIGLGTWMSTTLKAINGTDPAVVGSGYDPAGGGDSSVGFRWKGGTLTQLGVLAGGKYSIPSGVSLDGSTVVGLTGTNSFQQAFIWTDADKLRTVVDELRARGLEPAIDLKLTNAMFVSDDGKTIVGSEYTTPSSFWRVVLK